MEVMVDGDSNNRMITDYQIMTTSPQKFPGAHYVAGMMFVGYLTSSKIQRFIANHSIDLFKCQTNFPLAVREKVEEK